MIVELTVETLEGGRAIAELNEKLRRIIGDVVERKHLGKERSVTLTVRITPKVEGDVNMPVVDWDVGCKMPGWPGMTTRGMIKAGGLYVSTTDLQNPLQGSLDDIPGYEEPNKD